MEKHYTLSKAAEILGVTTQTLRNWDNAGKIRTIRTPGNQRRIPESEISRLSNPDYGKKRGVEFDELTEAVGAVGAVGAQRNGSTVLRSAQSDGFSVPGVSEQKRINTTEPTPCVFDPSGEPDLLMCTDVPVYDIKAEKILDERYVPGALLKGTLTFTEWEKTRFSSDSNFTAVRLMQRAFGKNDLRLAATVTRALSLSDCYWLKRKNEQIEFSDVSPYFNSEWDGNGKYTDGSISTIFTAGTKDKYWIDSNTLLKKNSAKESDVYSMCLAIGIDYIPATQVIGEDLKLSNFTSPGVFLETIQQSGIAGDSLDPREPMVEMFGETAVALFVVDYLVENSDRHGGNFGFLRNVETGLYEAMCPYYDFGSAWSGEVMALPDIAYAKFSEYIRSLAGSASKMSNDFEFGSIIERRAAELLK